MIPSTYHLTLNNKTPLRGRKFYTPNLLIICQSSPTPRWAVSISKKTEPHAVNRNRLRRQILNYLYQNRLRALPGDYLIIVKNNKDDVITDLLHEVTSICLNSTD